MLSKKRPLLSDTVDHNGKHIDQWKASGIQLDIPQGAIPQGKYITLLVTASTSQPLSLPEGCELVSPVYTILPSFRFISDITLRIEHWALLKDESSVSRMALVHASEEEVQIIHRGVFQERSSWGVVRTSSLSTFAACRQVLVPGIFLSLLSVVHPQNAAGNTYEVDICTHVPGKATEWISHLCFSVENQNVSGRKLASI